MREPMLLFLGSMLLGQGFVNLAVTENALRFPGQGLHWHWLPLRKELLMRVTAPLILLIAVTSCDLAYSLKKALTPELSCAAKRHWLE